MMPSSSPTVPPKPVAPRRPPARVGAHPVTVAGMGRELSDRAILVPPVLLGGLVILLAGAVSFRLALRPLLGPLQLVLLLALLGLAWRLREMRTVRAMLGLGLLALLAAWLALFDWAGHWLRSLGDVSLLHPDAWNYAGMGDYFGNHPRGRDSGMSMLDQYASKFSEARFASAGLLAFFQQFGALKEAPLNHTALYLVCLVTQFFSLLYLTHTLLGGGRHAFGVAIGAAFFGTAVGWSANLLGLANYDNLLFLSLCPAAVALLSRQTGDAGEPAAATAHASFWWWPAAVLLAAMFYAYAEGFVLLLVMLSPLMLKLMATGFRDRQRWFGYGALAGLTTLMAWPYAPTFFSFARNQFLASQGGFGALPGVGVYEGLLAPGRWLPALFALGAEYARSERRWTGWALALLLLAFTGVGARAISRRFPWFGWAVVPIAALYLWQAVFKHYDYGAFKIVACAAWWTYPAAAVGFAVVTARLGFRGWMQGVAAVALLLAVGREKVLDRRTRQPLLAAQMQTVRELRGLRFVTGGAPLALNLDGDFEHLWAVYYLRDQPLAALHQRHYLAGEVTAASLKRGRMPDAGACLFVLVSGAAPNALWHNAHFSLVPATRQFIADVINPQGVELFQDDRLLWVGTGEATFLVVVDEAGDYELRANLLGLGPALPDKTLARIALDDGHGSRNLEVRADTRALPLRLERGENRVRIKCLDAPVPGPHNGDMRELMLAIKGPQIGRGTATPNP